jgi:DNA-binding MarR family transcriptional regulator
MARGGYADPGGVTGTRREHRAPMKEPTREAPPSDAFTDLCGTPPEYFARMTAEFPSTDASAIKVFLALRTATRRVENVVSQWLDKSGMTITKLDVLHLLASTNDDGATISKLRDFLKMTQPNVTFVVQSLERDGLVRRTVDPSDRRMSVVHITPAGTERILELTPHHIGAMAEAVAGLDGDDRARFITLLAAVAQGFERTENVPHGA